MQAAIVRVLWHASMSAFRTLTAVGKRCSAAFLVCIGVIPSPRRIYSRPAEQDANNPAMMFLQFCSLYRAAEAAGHTTLQFASRTASTWAQNTSHTVKPSTATCGHSLDSDLPGGCVITCNRRPFQVQHLDVAPRRTFQCKVHQCNDDVSNFQLSAAE